MITSKLSHARTTIPQPVRDALQLKAGDQIAYVIEGDRAVITRAGRDHSDHPFATFDEWDGEADRKAFAGL
jgi:antitoxin PrlF